MRTFVLNSNVKRQNEIWNIYFHAIQHEKFGTTRAELRVDIGIGEKKGR